MEGGRYCLLRQRLRITNGTLCAIAEGVVVVAIHRGARGPAYDRS